MNAFREGPTAAALSWLRFALGVGGGTILVVLLARTAVGATDRTPGPMTIAVLAVVGFALALTVWRLDDAVRPANDWLWRAARAAAAILSGLLFGLLLARDSLPGLVSVLMLALATTVGAAIRIRNTKMSGRVPRSSATTEPDDNAATRLAMDAAFPVADDPSLRMQLRRYRDDDAERIDLQARLEFLAGAREAVLHVPFWPALATVPEVDCEPLDGDDIDLRVSSAEPYGMRIEGRLPTAAITPRTILIGVEVRCAAASDEQTAAA